MIHYDFIAYDVWGNEEDGWEINSACFTGESIDVPADASDTQILATFFDDDTLDKVEVDPVYCDGDVLYIRERGNHRPVGELRPWR